MRRMTLGLAAAAVIAGSVGLAGKAEATIVTLAAGQTLTSGNLTWLVVSCAFTNSTDSACGNLEMTASGNGIVITGNPAPATIQSVAGTGTDFTAVIEEFTVNNAATIGSASLISSGGTGADSATITNAQTNILIGYVGNAASTHPVSSISFTPVNDIYYSMDNHVSGGLVSVSAGTPVPEPASFGLFALALLATAAVRLRPTH